MTINEWHARLADTFTVGGVIGGHLTEVMDKERAIGEHLVATFRGQNALIDAFQSFYVQTLDVALQKVVENGWPTGSTSYPLAVAQFVTLFRRYRAGEILFYNGYPLDAYSLLRDIKDRALMLAGVAHNMTTIPKMIGAIPSIPDKVAWKKKSTRSRKDEENRITRRILGDNSDLPADVVSELGLWDALFHEEVHGGKLSLVHEIESMTVGAGTILGPTFHEQALAVYMNRSSELGWLLLRLLPYLQTTANGFGDEWHRKNEILDDSFRFMINSFTTIGKQIGSAFIAMVDAKFSFKQPFSYFEADGSL